MNYVFKMAGLILLCTLSGLLYGQELVSDTINAEEVVITGNRVDVAKRNIPLTVSVIEEKEVEESREMSVLPLLSQKVPGLFITERGVTGFGVATGAAGKISIRGIGGSPNSQVLVLIDGQPQYMGIFGHPLPDAYVTSDVKKIEVIRGPAGILYGSNAMGGVINIITKKQAKDGLKGTINSMLGSYNTRKLSGTLGYKKNNFDIFLSANYNDTDGQRDSSGFRIYNSYLKAGYRINRHISATADVNIASSLARDPGMEGFPAGEEVDMLRGKVALSIDNRFAFSEGSIKLFHNWGEHKITDGFHSTDNMSGLLFYQGFSLMKGNLVTAGIDYKQYGGMAENRFANEGNGILFADETIDETGLYVYIQQNIGKKVILTTGLRNEINKIYGSELVPQAGLTWHPGNQNIIKASVSKGFRNPTMAELYLWNAANSDLRPERMWNYEIGWSRDLAKKKVRMEINAFVAKGDNLIQVTGQYPEVKNENSGSFSHYGFELHSRYQVNKRLDMMVNYSFLHMDAPLLAAPGHHAVAECSYHKNRFGFSFNVEFVGDLYTIVTDDPAFPDEKENYLLANCNLTYRVRQWLTLYFKGENLTNTDYQINYGYPMPGIMAFGGIQCNFGSN